VSYPHPPRPPRGPIDWLGRAAWVLLLAAIAINVAWALIRPFIPIVFVVVVMVGLARWWLTRRWY